MLRRGWHTWAQAVLRQRRQEQLPRRALILMQHAMLSRGWRGWVAAVQTLAHQEQVLTSVVGCLAHGLLHRGWRGWRAMVRQQEQQEAEERNRQLQAEHEAQVLSRAVAWITHGMLRRGWLRWELHARQMRAVEHTMARAASCLMHGFLHRGFRRWTTAVESQRHQETVLRRVVSWLEHGLLRRGWRGWTVLVRKLQEVDHEAALTAWRTQRLTRGAPWGGGTRSQRSPSKLTKLAGSQSSLTHKALSFSGHQGVRHGRAGAAAGHALPYAVDGDRRRRLAARAASYDYALRLCAFPARPVHICAHGPCGSGRTRDEKRAGRGPRRAPAEADRGRRCHSGHASTHTRCARVALLQAAFDSGASAVRGVSGCLAMRHAATADKSWRWSSTTALMPRRTQPPNAPSTPQRCGERPCVGWYCG